MNIIGNLFKFKGILTKIFLLFFWLGFSESFAAETNVTETNIVGAIKIHNVGQGNCITLEVKEHGKAPQYMLVDIGSSAYAREVIWQGTQHTPPSSPIPHSLPQGSLPHTPSSSSSSMSTAPRTIEKVRHLPPSGLGTGGGKVREGILGKIREALGSVNEGSPIHVKTIVITHPDEDHYGWLVRLLSERDQVDNIILGGLPENYSLETLELLDSRRKNTKIFFPAISYNPIPKNTELDG